MKTSKEQTFEMHCEGNQQLQPIPQLMVQMIDTSIQSDQFQVHEHGQTLPAQVSGDFQNLLIHFPKYFQSA
jgi:hypothetical protein